MKDKKIVIPNEVFSHIFSFFTLREFAESDFLNKNIKYMNEKTWEDRCKKILEKYGIKFSNNMNPKEICIKFNCLRNFFYVVKNDYCYTEKVVFCGASSMSGTIVYEPKKKLNDVFLEEITRVKGKSKLFIDLNAAISLSSQGGMRDFNKLILPVKIKLTKDIMKQAIDFPMKNFKDSCFSIDNINISLNGKDYISPLDYKKNNNSESDIFSCLIL